MIIIKVDAIPIAFIENEIRKLSIEAEGNYSHAPNRDVNNGAYILRKLIDDYKSLSEGDTNERR